MNWTKRMQAVVLLGGALSACVTDDVDEPIGTAESELVDGEKCIVSGTGKALYDEKRGRKLAQAGLALSNGKASRGLCYAGVKDIFKRAGLPVNQTSLYDARYGLSAYQFARLARERPGQLAKLGLAKSRYDPNDIPRGAVLVWGRGVCGYNKTHGHIEVAAGNGRACSDFCGRIRRGCGKPIVFIPVDRGGK